MRLRPGICKAAKWTGAAVTISLLAGWIASGWYMWAWVRGVGTGEDMVYLWGGELRYISVDPVPSPRPQQSGGGFVEFDGLSTWFAYENFTMGGTRTMIFSIPLWSIPFLSAIPTGLLFYLDRRATLRKRSNLCPHCSFSLAGLTPETKCPECGKLRG